MVDGIGVEHIGVLGMSAPAAIAMLWKHIQGQKEQIALLTQKVETLERERGDMGEKLSRFKGDITQQIQTNRGEAEHRAVSSTQALEKQIVAHEEQIEKRLDSLEGKIDKITEVVYKIEGRSHVPPQQHAPGWTGD